MGRDLAVPVQIIGGIPAAAPENGVPVGVALSGLHGVAQVPFTGQGDVIARLGQNVRVGGDPFQKINGLGLMVPDGRTAAAEGRKGFGIYAAVDEPVVDAVVGGHGAGEDGGPGWRTDGAGAKAPGEIDTAIRQRVQIGGQNLRAFPVLGEVGLVVAQQE